MQNNWRNKLFKQVDNSALVWFRMAFGFLLACEAFGHIATGALYKHFLEPQFTFTFIDFSFLKVLPSPLMYGLFILMGIAGLCVMLGYKYRVAMTFYAVAWAYVYLLQKTSYNNHYYLLMLLNFIMIGLPAHQSLSLDAKIKPGIRKEHMPQWIYFFIIAFLGIIYSYASIAKFYPDWIDLSFPRHLMRIRAKEWGFLQEHWAHIAIMIYGLTYDLLIVPFLLWKRTRWIAVGASIVFHLFNSIIFKIGIFPYLALAFIIFFFEPQQVKNWFFKKKTFYNEGKVIIPRNHRLLTTLLAGFLIIMTLLPLRHWVIKDDVLWTEEGHRLSWRMMLRNRVGQGTFYVENKATGEKTRVNYRDYLTPKQAAHVKSKPDFIWQFAQHLKEKHRQNGEDIAVYARLHVSINGRPYQPFTNPRIDIAATDWDRWKHHTWILPSQLYQNKD